jgi:hypothetical protein
MVPGSQFPVGSTDIASYFRWCRLWERSAGRPSGVVTSPDRIRPPLTLWKSPMEESQLRSVRTWFLCRLWGNRRLPGSASPGPAERYRGPPGECAGRVVLGRNMQPATTGQGRTK